MVKKLAPLLALLLGAALLLTAGGILGLAIPLRGQAEGFSTFMIGVMGGAYSLGFVLGCVVVPRWAARVGHVRSFAVVAALAAIDVLLTGAVVTAWSWIMLRALMGFCFAGAFALIESWINDAVSATTRGAIYGVYMIINLVSVTLGQMLVPLIGSLNSFTFTLAAVLFCASLIPTAISTSRLPTPIVHARLRLGKLIETSPVATLGIFSVGLANGAFGTLGAIYASQVGLTDTFTALFVSAVVVGGALTQVPLGRLSDRIDRRIVIAGAAAAAALLGWLIVLLGVITGNATTIIVLATLFGGFAYILYALASAHANDFAAAEDFLETSSGLLLLFGLGAALGPILASMFMRGMGASGLFMFTGIVHAALCAFTVFRMTRRAAIPAGQRDPARLQPLAQISAATPSKMLFDPTCPDKAVERFAAENDAAQAARQAA